MKFMSDEALRYNMSIGLKNSLQILGQLNPYIQFAVNEECASMSECGLYASFLQSKPVFHIEYVKRNRGSGLGELFGSSTTDTSSQSGSSSLQSALSGLSGLGGLFGLGSTTSSGASSGLSWLGSLFGGGSQSPAASQTAGARQNPGLRGNRGGTSGTTSGWGSLLGPWFGFGASPASSAAPYSTAAPESTAAPVTSAVSANNATAKTTGNVMSSQTVKTPAATQTPFSPFFPQQSSARASPAATGLPAFPFFGWGGYNSSSPRTPAPSNTTTSASNLSGLGLVAAGVGGILSGVYSGVTGLLSGLRSDQIEFDGGIRPSDEGPGDLPMVGPAFKSRFMSDLNQTKAEKANPVDAGLLRGIEALGDDAIIKNACNPGYGLATKFSTVVKNEALDGWVRFCDGRIMVTRVSGPIRGIGRLDAEMSEIASEFSEQRGPYAPSPGNPSSTVEQKPGADSITGL
jgi:Glycoside-hydrolase family GH114